MVSLFINRYIPIKIVNVDAADKEVTKMITLY